MDDNRAIKLARIREIRDQILNQTDWITSYISKEKLAVDLGVLVEADRRWTSEQILSYLQWCQALCLLPNQLEIDLERLDVIDIDADLYAENTAIFPACPLETELTTLNTVNTTEGTPDVAIPE